MRLSVNFWGWLLALLLTGWGTASHAQFGSSGGWYAPSGDASSTGYTPADGSDWADPDPSWVNTALDTLAAAIDGATVPDASGAANGDLLTANGAGSYGWVAPSFISNLVEDLTPQLGGDLDVNGSSLVSASNGDIDIDPDGTGRVTVQSALYCAGDIEFEGSTADGFETTLAVTDPTADRTLTLPDETGTILTGASSADSRINVNGLVADGSPDGAADYAVTWDASAATHKKVLLDDLPGGGGGGEANTASNVGDGADVFKQKTGVDLEFRGVKGVESVSSVVSGDNIEIELSGDSAAPGNSKLYGTNGAGTKGWYDQPTSGIASVSADSSPALGGNLDVGAYTLIFEGSTADANEATLTVADPTADRTLTLPDATGTILTTGNLGDLPTLATVSAYYAGAGDATDTALTGSTTTTIVYDTETTDTGGDYNNSTGVFTAPADGIYFYAASLNHSGNTVVRPVIQVDTGGGYSDHRHGTDADQQPDGNTGLVTGVISLSSGDLLRFAGQNKTATQGRLRGTAFNTQNVTHLSIQQLR